MIKFPCQLIILCPYFYGFDVVLGFRVIPKLGEPLPETVSLQPRKWIRHAGLGPKRHDTGVISIPGLDQTKEGLDKVTCDLPLGDQIHDGEEKKRFVRCPVVSNCRVPVTVLSVRRFEKALMYFSGMFSHG